MHLSDTRIRPVHPGTPDQSLNGQQSGTKPPETKCYFCEKETEEEGEEAGRERKGEEGGSVGEKNLHLI